MIKALKLKIKFKLNKSSQRCDGKIRDYENDVKLLKMIFHFAE
jgi:hypothetical protein